MFRIQRRLSKRDGRKRKKANTKTNEDEDFAFSSSGACAENVCNVCCLLVCAARAFCKACSTRLHSAGSPHCLSLLFNKNKNQQKNVFFVDIKFSKCGTVQYVHVAPCLSYSSVLYSLYDTTSESNLKIGPKRAIELHNKSHRRRT